MRRSLPLTCLAMLLFSVSSASAQQGFPFPQPPEDRLPFPQPTEPGLPAEGAPERSPAETKALAEKIYKDEIAPILQAACYHCHGNRKATVGLNLQRLKLDFDNPATAETWQRVYERVRDGEMPPPGAKGLTVPAPKAMDTDLGPSFPLQEIERERAGRHVAIGSLQKLFHAARREREVFDSGPRIFVGPEDTPVMRLQKQARNAALERVDIHMQQYELGTLTHEVVLEALLKLYNLELPLASNHEQRIDVLTRSVAAHRHFEENVYVRFAAAREDKGKFLAAKTARLEAQLRLQAELDKKPKQLR